MEVTSTLDWSPTMVEIMQQQSAKTSPLASHFQDGVSILGLISAEDPTAWRRPRPLGVCRSLLQDTTTIPLCETVAWIDSNYKLIAARVLSSGTKYFYKAVSLFDLDLDPTETHDIASDYAARVANMTQELQVYFASVLTSNANNCDDD